MWWIHVIHLPLFFRVALLSMVQSFACPNAKEVTLTDSKVDGANVGPTWGQQDPGGPHVGHMNFAIWAGTIG